MAEAVGFNFDDWLRDTLVALNTDDEVFSPYIKGILEGDENPDEKLEALQGILAEITGNGMDTLCQDILHKWKLNEATGPTEETCQVAADERLARIMEEQAQIVVTTRVRTQEEENLKSAILAQYAQVSDGEVTDSEEEHEVGIHNTNAEDVAKAERDKREKNKEDSQRKKEKDKEDRAKQKAKDDERKEKEKKRTQKGERRR